MLPQLEQRLRRAGGRPAGLRPLGPAPAGASRHPEALADAVEDELARAGLRDGAPRRQLARRLDRPRARAARPRPDRHRDLARRAPARAREALGRGGAARHALDRPKGAAARAAAPQSGHPHRSSPGPHVGRPWRYDPDELMEHTRAVRQLPRLRGHAPHHLPPPAARADELDVPVLILWGTLDVILLPRQGRRFERLIPGAELRYIRGIGHVPMSDAPDELADAIAEFALDRRRAPVAQAAAARRPGSHAVADRLRVGQLQRLLVARSRRRAACPLPAPPGRPSGGTRRRGPRRSAPGRAGRSRGRRCRRRARRFSFATSSARSPPITVELFHSGSFSVEETTYLGMLLNLSANSPSRDGHASAKPS